MAEPLDEAALVAKLRALPAERREQVRAFVDFLVGQEAERGQAAPKSAASKAVSRQVRASLDAAMRGHSPGSEPASDDERERKALDELARRFPEDDAEEAH